jgi:transcriptional regulator
MYLPSRFQASDAEIEEIVREHPFATLITGGEISHVPLVLEKRGAEWVLVGHLARANAHWRSLEGAGSVAVFHGPNSYVTPLWYAEHDVPTWNYVTAHLTGQARLLSGEAATVGALRALAAHVDPDWEFAIPEDLAGDALTKAIVAFEIPVASRQGKLKLSQNRSSSDVAGVIAGLGTRQDEQSRGVLAWMQRPRSMRAKE